MNRAGATDVITAQSKYRRRDVPIAMSYLVYVNRVGMLNINC